MLQRSLAGLFYVQALDIVVCTLKRTLELDTAKQFQMMLHCLSVCLGHKQ